LFRIYLLRHGIAEDGKPGSPDSERALTADGKRRLKSVLRLAKDAGVSPRLIVTSPYQRALQSAEVAAEVLGYAREFVRSESITPDSDPVDAWSEIRSYASFEDVLVVSHEPLLGNLFGYLLGSAALRVDFKKGALARIDLEGAGPHPRGVLRWFLPPKVAVS
jgi:phosphohistidine phosphatase